MKPVIRYFLFLICWLLTVSPVLDAQQVVTGCITDASDGTPMTYIIAYRVSIAKSGIDEKIHHIPEVTIKAKKRTKEQEILYNRSTSIAHYDVASEIEDIHDRGELVIDDIHVLLKKMNLEGYSVVKEFYSPNYSELPNEIDYRRTLYWNPNVTTDENGRAKIQFYNNSRCTNFSISAETVTAEGKIGIYR